MGRFSEITKRRPDLSHEKESSPMRGQQFGALNVASRHYFAACSRHVACLAMMGMTLCTVPAAASALDAQPAKTAVQRVLTSGQEGESNMIPYEQLAINNSWTSSNHEDSSVSSQSWEIKSPGGDMELSFDYEVSSESNCDWLTITLDGNELVRVSGEVKDHYSVNGLPAGSHVLTATYSKDGSVSHGNDLGMISNITTSDAVNMAQAFLTNLGDYKGLEKELTAALQPAADNREDSVAYAALCTTYANVVKAYNYWPIIQEDISIAGDVLAGGAYVDIAEAVKLGQAISLATSQSAEYIAAYNALETSLAVYNSDKVEMSDWAFNMNTYYTIDGLNYYIDEKNGLAAFANLSIGNLESLDIPVTVRLNDKVYAVVAIMQRNYYYGRENIKSITLPKTLRYIGDYGLADCNNVKEITIPENVEYIGNYVFENDDSLTRVKSEAAVPPSLGSFGRNNLKITIPRESFHAYRLAAGWNNNNVLVGGDEGVTISTGKIAAGELGHIVVDEATYLQEVNKLVVEGNMNSDDWNTISKMSNLTEVDLSGVALETVPSSAFNGRWAIDKVVLPESVISIGEYAFRGSGVRSVNLPEGLTNVGVCAFENAQLEELNLPENLQQLGNGAFGGNYRLLSVKIPPKITVIPGSCFQNCSQLAKVELPDGIIDIKDYAFRGCNSLESVNFPNTLRYIRYRAFSNCSSLNNLQLNEGIVGIYENAFAGCTGLTELVLPSSLEYCSGSPFANCSGIKTIESRAVLPPTTGGNYNPLSGVDLSQLVLYVPTWSVNEYQLADG